MSNRSGSGDPTGGSERTLSPADPAINALQNAAEWLRVTLSSIGDGVITTDPHGRVTMLNPVAQQLTGWTQEAAVSRNLTEVFHIVNQDTRKEVENPALRALRDGVIVGLANHTVLIAKDGTERPIDDCAAPIRSGKGEVGGAVLVFRDITERYRQEKLVKDAFEYAANILETQREPFLVLDKELRVVSGNRAYYQTFHVSKQETEGRFIYQLGNSQWDIPQLRKLLEEVLTQNHAFENFEVEQTFETIGPKVMLLNAGRIRKPGNHSELILLAIEDITVRRFMERSLHESEVRYRRLFQTAKDGILILDAASGKIIDANAFMTSLTGMDLPDLIGKELYEIGLFKDIEANKAAFRELQRAKYIRYEHLPMQNTRGERVEIEMVANVYPEDHRLVAQCNVRDISQRVAMEKKIAEQAEAIASESRRKDEFLAMLSHELRNPLAPIRSAVHLLRTQERAGAENLLQKQAHEIIERQVASLTKLVSDLLEVSRVVSGRIRLNQQVVDLNQIVTHAVETSRPLISQRKHVLRMHMCEDGVWVNADPTRLEEVFVNILNNAAKYTPDEGAIDIYCEHPRGNHSAQVRVRDTGVGIEKKLLPRIFDLFTQADRSLARSAGGLGIGLSLAHRLIDLHGGTIEVTSPPAGADVGSEFIVRLPMAATPPQRQAPEAPAYSANESGLRILLVDDNIDLVMMLASALRQRGHSVETAYTGPHGLAMAQSWRPDVVLLDIGLPGLDGYEVARRLRADPHLAAPDGQVKIIALTGYGRETDKALAQEAGFDGHLIKPVEFKELEKMLAVPPSPSSRPTLPAGEARG